MDDLEQLLNQAEGVGNADLPSPVEVPPDDLDSLLQQAEAPQESFWKQQIDPGRERVKDLVKTTTSWPLRGLANIAGLPGLVEKGATWAAEQLGEPASEHTQHLPTPDDILNNLRERDKTANGGKPSLQADYLLHEPSTPGGKVVGFTEDLFTPGGFSKGVSKADEAITSGRKLAEAIAQRSPSPDALAREVRSAYQDVSNAGIHYHPDDVAAWVSVIKDRIKNYDVDPEITGLLNRMEEAAHSARISGQGISLPKLDSYRKEAGRMWSDVNATDSEESALGTVRSELDYLGNHGRTTAGNVSGAEGQALLQRARGLAQRNIRDKQLEEANNIGENLAGEGLQTADYSNKVRQRLRRIISNDKVFSRYSPEQQRALQDAYHAGEPMNMRSEVSRAAASHLISQALATGIGDYIPGARIGAAWLADKVNAGIRSRDVVRRNRAVAEALQEARALMRMENTAGLPSRVRLTSSDIVRALLQGGAVSGGALGTDLSNLQLE